LASAPTLPSAPSICTGRIWLDGNLGATQTQDVNSGNGLLGVGFGLGGLSAIHRCSKTIAIDGVKGGVNYDDNDRYCLDAAQSLTMDLPCASILESSVLPYSKVCPLLVSAVQ
jgi:hypothetical protein